MIIDLDCELTKVDLQWFIEILENKKIGPNMRQRQVTARYPEG